MYAEKHFTGDFSSGTLNNMSELGSIQRKPIHQLFLDCLSYLLSKNWDSKVDWKLKFKVFINP